MPADFPSRLDLFQLARNYVLTRAVKIDPSQVDTAGSDVNLYVGIASVLGYQIVLSLIQNINALQLDGAFDEDLDRYGVDRYQLPRKGAAAALGTVRIFRASATAGAGNVPPNTKLLTLNGIEYITVASATFGALDLTKTVDVRAVQAGKISQVGANQIRQFSTPGVLFDQTLQVNNDAPTAGGEDPEDDETYRERIRQFWSTARRGTLSAIEFGATTVDGVVSAVATEALTAEPMPARVVKLRVADSSGSSSAALGATVIAALDEYRAAGIAVVVEDSAPQLISIQLKLTFGANVDTVTITESVRGAVVEYVNSLGVGQTLLKSAIYSVLTRFTSAGVIVTQDSVLAPVGDLVPDVGKTLRTRFQDVTVV
jgi:uncharacterized phage protein gp47/JayE